MRSTTCSSSGRLPRSSASISSTMPLVVGVGELLVAADRLVLGDPLRVVGVVAVGRAARGDHDPSYVVGQAGVEHVAGAVDVDRTLERAGRVLARRHDRGEVDDHLGSPLVHDLVDAGSGRARPSRRDGRRRRARPGTRRSALVTSWPASTSPATTEVPRKPLPPVTRTLMRRPAARCRRTTAPDDRDDQPGDDVVDAPPGGDQRHPAEAVEVGEHQQQPEPGVAYADLERHRLDAGRRQPRGAADRPAEQQGERVVQEHRDHARCRCSSRRRPSSSPARSR